MSTNISNQTEPLLPAHYEKLYHFNYLKGYSTACLTPNTTTDDSSCSDCVLIEIIGHNLALTFLHHAETNLIIFHKLKWLILNHFPMFGICHNV